MKNLCLFAFIALSLAASAKTVQKGFVQEYNEKARKTPLPGVELDVRSAQSTVSDSSGRFTLDFLTLKPGERVSVRRIEKVDYEILNKEAIEQWNINPAKPFNIKMCRSDKFKRIRDNNRNISIESYVRQHKKDVAAIEKLKAEGKLRDEEYCKQLSELQENYDRQFDNLENYVDRFSRIDLSELSSTEQEIIDLVQQGRIDEAIAKYEQQDYVGKYIQETSQIHKVDAAINKLTDVKQTKEQHRDSILAIVSRQVETLQLAGGRENNLKAVAIIRQIADADTTNATWALKAGDAVSCYLSDYALALKYYNTALHKLEKNKDVYELAMAYNLIGKVYSYKGEYKTALYYFQKSLKLHQSSQGNQDLSLATTYNNIGIAYSTLGEPSKSLDYCRQALSIEQNLLPPDSPDIALLYNNLGIAYSTMGKPSEAIDCYKSALSIYEESLMAGHPSLALTYNNLGLAYSLTGRQTEAISCYKKALAIYEKAFGEKHPDTARTYNNLGLVYYTLNQDKESFEYYQKAIAIQEPILGIKHPETSRTYNNLGMYYLKKTEYAKSIDAFKKALAAYSGLSNTNDYEASIHTGMALCYLKTENYKESLNSYKKALQILQNTENIDALKLSLLNADIASVYLFMKDFKSAINHYQEALKVGEDRYNDNLPVLYAIYSGLGFANYSLGDESQAKKYAEKMIEIQQRLEKKS